MRFFLVNVYRFSMQNSLDMIFLNEVNFGINMACGLLLTEIIPSNPSNFINSGSDKVRVQPKKFNFAHKPITA